MKHFLGRAPPAHRRDPRVRLARLEHRHAADPGHGQGSLTNPQSVALTGTDDVRVAVVWRSGAGQFNVAEDLPVSRVFPVLFHHIQLDSPPPASAMNSGASPQTPLTGNTAPSTGGPPPPGRGIERGDRHRRARDASRHAGRQSGGRVDDAGLRHRDGGRVPRPKPGRKLDLVPDNAAAYVDQILAANEEMSIVYFQGAITPKLGLGYPLVDPAGHGPTDRYNLLQVRGATRTR